VRLANEVVALGLVHPLPPAGQQPAPGEQPPGERPLPPSGESGRAQPQPEDSGEPLLVPRQGRAAYVTGRSDARYR
jgi:hypothetical protein